LSREPDGGFRLATRIEDGVERPNVGLVVQADANFYSPLIRRFSGWDGLVAVRKRGSGKETRYEFARIVGDPVEVPQADASFDALLEGLADETEMQRIVHALVSGPYVRAQPSTDPCSSSSGP
jgi:hypothetical protein